MQLKGIELNGVYTVSFTKHGFMVFDENDNEVYIESAFGYWAKTMYNEKGKAIYYENSKGEWFKKEYDENNNAIYLIDSNANWWKKEFDKDGNEVYFEDSTGLVIGKRLKQKENKK